jgi:nicotinamide riboside kinase
MRIGICGAQSTGKTTLLNALRSEPCFKHYSICDEVTRKVQSYNLPINEFGNDTTQKLIMHEHIVNVFMNENMITDRTVLDGLVYTRYLYGNGVVKTETVKYAESVFSKVWSRYDYVFYIEPEFDIENDGVRSIDLNFRDSITDLFHDEIISQDLKVILIKGSVRQRVNTVLSTIGEKI